MIHKANYHVAREYLRFRAEVMQLDDLTVRAEWLWLKHLLRWADDVPFSKAPSIRPVLPRHLATARRHDRPEKSLSTVGTKRACQVARAFFEWLSRTHPRQYQNLSPSWVATIRPVKGGGEPRKEHQAVTLEMVRRLLTAEVAPGDLATRRDKAAAAFLFLSGVRATAFLTLGLHCVDIASRTVRQLPSMGVRTKNRKAGVTHLLEIPDLLQVVEEWDAFVRARLDAPAPWYPVISQSFGRQSLTDRAPGRFRNRDFGRRIQRLFDLAGLPPMTPHKFRHGHAVHGLNLAKDMGDLKAISMNLMHSSISITDSIYAVFSDKDTQGRIAQLGQAGPAGFLPASIDKDRFAAAFLKALAELQLKPG